MLPILKVMKNNIIKKIVLEIDGKEPIELTMKQAKQLFDGLEDLFGKTIIEKHVHHHEDSWPRRKPWITWGGMINPDNGLKFPQIAKLSNETLTVSVK